MPTIIDNINAWENDNDTDPILSIIYEISKQLCVDFSVTDKNFVRTAGAIVEAISGHNVNGILDELKSDDPFTTFKEQKDIEEKVKLFLSGLLAERGNRLVIFIDELDRCNPNFAVHLLEQVKHYLHDERITFVFSVNLEQLQHTIKHYYGADFDSCRYLDRFFDLRIALPQANMDKFYWSIGLNDSSYTVDINIKRIAKMLHFELREITRFYAQVKAATYVPTHDSSKYSFDFSDGNGRKLILTYIVPLIIGLEIADISLRDEFVNGKNSTPLKELVGMDKYDYLSSYLINEDECLKEEEGKKLVTRDELVERIYNAIFVNTYEGRTYSTHMGDYEFTNESKSFAIGAASMLSNYADYSK